MILFLFLLPRGHGRPEIGPGKWPNGQPMGRFAAMCCDYDDDFLLPSIAPVKHALNKAEAVHFDHDEDVRV